MGNLNRGVSMSRENFITVIVIRIQSADGRDLGFLSDAIWDKQTETGIVIRKGRGKALLSLVSRAVDAYHWKHPQLARNCALELARGECRGYRVRVDAFAIEAKTGEETFIAENAQNAPIQKPIDD